MHVTKEHKVFAVLLFIHAPVQESTNHVSLALMGLKHLLTGVSTLKNARAVLL